MPPADIQAVVVETSFGLSDPPFDPLLESHAASWCLGPSSVDQDIVGVVAGSKHTAHSSGPALQQSWVKALLLVILVV